MNYHLYYFSTPNGEREFVVISNQPRTEVISEYEGDAELVESHEIKGDCTSLPCDRALAIQYGKPGDWRFSLTHRGNCSNPVHTFHP